MLEINKTNHYIDIPEEGLMRSAVNEETKSLNNSKQNTYYLLQQHYLHSHQNVFLF